MHSNLIKVLKHMSDTDFQELHHNMKIANKMRRIKHEFVLDHEDFADELNVQVPEVKNMMNAAYSFDIRMVSKIDVFERKLIEEADVFEEEPEEEEPAPQHEAGEEEGVFQDDEEPIKLNPNDDIELHPVQEDEKATGQSGAGGAEEEKKEEPTSSDTEQQE